MAYLLMQPSLWIGSGDPNGQVTASRGAAAYRTDGGQNATFYVKESGDDTSTGWVAYGASGGGADPWTYVKLASDFTTTSGTAVAVTGLSFAPAANTSYELEVVLFLQTATATVGARPGLSWPTGLARNVGWAMAATSLTAFVSALWGGTAAAAAISTGFPVANVDNPGLIRGALVAGATPSGAVQVTLSSETAGTTVRAMAGSFLKYRTF